LFCGISTSLLIPVSSLGPPTFTVLFLSLQASSSARTQSSTPLFVATRRHSSVHKVRIPRDQRARQPRRRGGARQPRNPRSQPLTSRGLVCLQHELLSDAARATRTGCLGRVAGVSSSVTPPPRGSPERANTGASSPDRHHHNNSNIIIIIIKNSLCLVFYPSHISMRSLSCVSHLALLFSHVFAARSRNGGRLRLDT
jgi:hypothetical protein